MDQRAELRTAGRRVGITLTGVNRIPAGDRQHVITAVGAVSACCTEPYEAWIAPGRRPSYYFLRIIGPHGFYREVKLEGGESEAAIAERVRMEVAPRAPARVSA